jgi:glycosyltransferase involved in cell wall biosynthesis
VGSARIKSRSEERAYSTFISKVESSKFRGKIELHGFVSAEDLKMLVQKSNYIWMPYLNSTQSIVAVSAKQFGTPVISTSLPTLMESFGNSGIYIDSVEPEDWSSALQRLIEIPDFTSERNLRAKLLRDLSSGQSMEQIALKIIG